MQGAFAYRTVVINDDAGTIVCTMDAKGNVNCPWDHPVRSPVMPIIGQQPERETVIIPMTEQKREKERDRNVDILSIENLLSRPRQPLPTIGTLPHVPLVGEVEPPANLPMVSTLPFPERRGPPLIWV